MPPWLLLLLLAEPEPDFLPPRLEAPSELEMAAARLLLMPFVAKSLVLLVVLDAGTVIFRHVADLLGGRVTRFYPGAHASQSAAE